MPTRREFLKSAIALPAATLAYVQDPKPASNGDIIFADFESGTYDDWTMTGNCWTREPYSDKYFPGKITGFQGKRFLCSLHPTLGTAATGKAVSREFTIEKPFINFLIGGGNHPGECCMNLVVDGKVVRTETGDDSSQFKHASWDVYSFIGMSARIEVVDGTLSDNRGYVIVDEIVFSSPSRQGDNQSVESIPRIGDPQLSSAAAEVSRISGAPGVWLGCAIGKRDYVGACGFGDIESKTTPNTDDRLMWASISKPITAFIAAAAMAEHGIDFSYKPIDELPELKKISRPEYLGITLEDLFSHQHNLPRDFRMQNLEAKDLTQLRLERIVDLLQQSPRPNPQHTGQYSNAGYVLLTYAIERKTGISWDALWQDFLIKRMHLTSFGMGKPPAGSPTPSQYWFDQAGKHQAGPDYRSIWRWQPSGGFHSTMQDLLRFGTALNDAFNGVQGGAISPAIAKSLAGNEKQGGIAIGSGDWLGPRELSCGGSLNSEKCLIRLVPKRRWVLVCYCNSGSDHDSLRDDWLQEALFNSVLKKDGIRTNAPCDVALTGVIFLDEDFKTPVQRIDPNKDIHVRINLSVKGARLNDFKATIRIGNSIASPTFLDGMDPGDHRFFQRLVNPGPGTHNITVELDPLHLINDIDRSNNSYKSTVEVGL